MKAAVARLAAPSFHKGDRGLQVFPVNEEFPVGAIHQIAPTESLPFVHTARRYYRLGDLARTSDRVLGDTRALGRGPSRPERRPSWVI